MNIKDYLKLLDKKDLAEIKSEIERIEKFMNNTITKGEIYWFINTDGEVFSETNKANMFDKLRNANPVFRTKEDAKEWAKALKIRKEYQQWCKQYPCDWKDDTQPKYYISYDHGESCIEIGSYYYCQPLGVISCSNKDHVQDFINKIGESDCVKYLFGIGLAEECHLEL